MSRRLMFAYPVLDPYNAPFWEAARAGRLSVQKCASCGALRFPPGPACPFCFAPAAVWVALCGRGTVHNWVVFHQNYFARYGATTPYAVALVKLDEGINLFTNLHGIAEDAIHAGLRVQAVFEKLNDRFTLPRFERCDAPRAMSLPITTNITVSSGGLS